MPISLIHRRRRVRVIVVVVLRVLMFFTLLGVMLALLSLGYDAATAAGVLLVIVSVAARVTMRLVGDLRPRGAVC